MLCRGTGSREARWNLWNHTLHPVQRGGRGCQEARQAWPRMGQVVGGLWAFGGYWRDEIGLLKMAVPTEGQWRVDEVVGPRG